MYLLQFSRKLTTDNCNVDSDLTGGGSIAGVGDGHPSLVPGEGRHLGLQLVAALRPEN